MRCSLLTQWHKLIQQLSNPRSRHSCCRANIANKSSLPRARDNVAALGPLGLSPSEALLAIALLPASFHDMVYGVKTIISWLLFVTEFTQRIIRRTFPISDCWVSIGNTLHKMSWKIHGRDFRLLSRLRSDHHPNVAFPWPTAMQLKAQRWSVAHFAVPHSSANSTDQTWYREHVVAM